MKKQTAMDYSLICVGSYTREHVESLIEKSTEIKFVHPLIDIALDGIPKRNQIVRVDLEVMERSQPYLHMRPANLFEILFFAQKFPYFPLLYGAIEGAQDPYLTKIFKEELRVPQMGHIILRYDSERDGLCLDLEKYGNDKRDTQFRLVVPSD